MKDSRSTLLCILALLSPLVLVGQARAEFGWTKQQIEAKYGKPIVRGQSYYYTFPEAKRIVIGKEIYRLMLPHYHEDKVVDISLQGESGEPGEDRDTSLGVKDYARVILPMLEKNADPRLITNVQVHDFGGGLEAFDYKDCTVNWAWKFSAQLRIFPREGTPLATASKAIKQKEIEENNAASATKPKP